MAEVFSNVGTYQQIGMSILYEIATLPELNARMSSNLDMQALYEISTLPEPERTKEHVTSKGIRAIAQKRATAIT